MQVHNMEIATDVVFRMTLLCVSPLNQIYTLKKGKRTISVSPNKQLNNFNTRVLLFDFIVLVKVNRSL